MTRRERLSILSGAPLLVTLASLPAHAEVDVQGSAEIGIAGVRLSDDTANYGRYTGIGSDDFHAIGAMSLSIARDHRYLDLSIRNAGLESREARIEGGAWGAWSLSLHHDRLPNLIHAGALSPYRGIGSDVLTLPDLFAQGATTADMGGLAESLQPLALRTRRDRNALEAALRLDEHWKTRLAFRHERKQGVQPLGGVVGQNPRFASAVILPQALDHTSTELDAGITYQRHRLQLEGNWHLANFSNAHRSLTWDVPYLQPSPQAFDYPDSARTGTTPDNRHHRLSLSAGIDLSPTARFSTIVELGRMDQNDALLPWSTDDIGGTAIITEDMTLLPTASARARIDTRHLGMSLGMQPLPRLGIVVRYRWHETDNRTPFTPFDRVVNDTGPQSFSQDLNSRPYEFARSRFDLDGRYRFTGGLGLRSYYRHESVDRGDHAPAGRTGEDTLGIAVNRRIASSAMWRIAYSHARREADSYNAFRSYSTLYDAANCPLPVTVDPDPDSGGITTFDSCFSNHPDLRMLHVANRKRDRLDARINLVAQDGIDVGIAWSRIADRYSDAVSFDDTLLGPVEDDSRALTIDVGYSPDPLWALQLYYTREIMTAIQSGRAFTAAAATAIDSTRNWRANFDNTIDTIGLNTQFTTRDGRSSVMASYVLAYERGDIDFVTGGSLDAVAMPENLIRRQTIEVSGSRELQENLTVNAGVEIETFRTRNWSLDTLSAGGSEIDAVLPLAGRLPDYRATLLWTSLRYTW